MGGVVGAVLGALDDWLPRSATAVAVVSGPLVLLGYLLGSVPFPYLLARRRLRRQLSRVDPDRLPPAADDALGVPGSVLAAVLAGLAALVATTVAWEVAMAATPGGSRFSAVGAYSNQVIGAWVSIALWSGAAAVAGHLGSVFLRFRGGTGLPPAVALALAHAPALFAAAAAVVVMVYAATRDARRGLLVALPVVVALEFWLWVSDTQLGWGVTAGPELALWTTVLAGMLFARNVRRPTV
jgi:glycerol-3-phosphate acyltransferase PlsY